ncbi:MAG: hypothetical protein J6M39_05730 [Lachnospiraceae bacterium]|nr:hypothetical protein [Lachnospiraceae bacterium]
MNKYKIWGKEFSLKVLYECKNGQKPTNEQHQALEMFENELFQKKEVNKIQHYLDSQKEIMNFISKLDGIDDVDINDSVLDYLKPVEIRVLNEKNRMVEIVCDFKFDMEHSIAIRFKNEKFDGFYQEEV